MPYGYGLYLMPPPKRMKWSTLHTFVLIMLVFHIGLLVVFGFFTPKLFKRKTPTYVVSLVKDVKVKKFKPKKKAGRKAGPKNPKKPPGYKAKAKKIDIAKPKQHPKRAKPNKPIKIDLPKQKYPTVDPKARAMIFKKKPNQHEKGAPSGEPDGILGSRGTGGEGFGEGGGEGGGGGGGEGGSGGGDRPWVFWEYDHDFPYKSYSSREENLRLYQQMINVGPYLSDPVVPSYKELIGLGHGEVELEITIPGVTEMPIRGVHPQDITVVRVYAEKSEMAERMKQIALWCVNASGWYPAKQDGEPIDRRIRLVLHFYGSAHEEL